ncbi:MAG: pilus (MSHA type) biogenesis protein MshL [Desulfobulbaceae bacterium]|nr:pilus (MSHA type) biogenesis protein MshL [Desulfobulbaceae bacterium]
MNMKSSKPALILIVLLMIFLVSCVNKETTTATPTNDAKAAPETAVAETKQQPGQLPVRFQSPGYYIMDEKGADLLGQDSEEFEIKVGANISSTRGPQPLWDILKRVANLRGMSVSWASDVDQNVLVDVDINADDNFFEAIDNMLRQVDYFHEVKGNTIIVKYRETRRFQISIPFMKGTYDSNIGGNFLTDRDAATGTEGTVKVVSSGNAFDVWQNITDNLNIIMQEWRTQQTEQQEVIQTQETDTTTGTEETVQQATRRISLGSSYYTLDKSIGLVTVTAPRPLLEKVGYYLENLKKELYRQVIIEAKIIEVSLMDNSKIGIDWGLVLKDFSVSGIVEFGLHGISDIGQMTGQVWPYVEGSTFDNDTGLHTIVSGDDFLSTGAFVSRLKFNNANFTVMLNALNEQGDATVLANPKLTVLNGQPAVLSVGRDIAYIKEVSTDINDNTGTVTFTVETDSVVEGIAFGVMASILDEDSVILHLTPITTDLVNGIIEYREFADGLEVGLPQVQIREMSTMVQVDNGEMLVIGGLIDSIEGKTENFAPLVGDVPVLRYLFGVKEKRLEKRELVILLTPRIL